MKPSRRADIIARRLTTIGLAAIVAVVLAAPMSAARLAMNTIGDQATILGAGHQAQVAVADSR